MDSLLRFFTDEADWAYVMDYEGCGIVSAQITSYEEGDNYLLLKRVVIKLRCGTVYSVIRVAGITPPGCWEAARLNLTERYRVDEKPSHHTTPDLFNTFKGHARS